MKLHLGCGRKKINGFVHVDSQAFSHVDYVMDLRALTSIKNEVASEIYACHVLEHFGRWEVVGVLQEWARVLKHGGILRLAVPDFEAVCARYGETKEISELLGLIVGGQKDPYDYHSMIFDFEMLQTLLVEAGFGEVGRYDTHSTDHAHVDDYSQAYLPHMDKKNGRLMSLNVQAKKLSS